MDGNPRITPGGDSVSLGLPTRDLSRLLHVTLSHLGLLPLHQTGQQALWHGVCGVWLRWDQR